MTNDNEGLDKEKEDRLRALVKLTLDMQRVKRTVGYKNEEEMWEEMIVPGIVLERELDIKSGERVVDVGSGGGFPGFILGILRDDIRIALLESSPRKCAVMEEIKRRLSINGDVVCGRAEDNRFRRCYDVAIAMWFSKLEKAIKVLENLVRSHGRVAIISGPGKTDDTPNTGLRVQHITSTRTMIYKVVSHETS